MLDIVEQLGQRMQLPPDSDVKEGRYLKWRAFRGVSFKTAMGMINELGNSGKWVGDEKEKRRAYHFYNLYASVSLVFSFVGNISRVFEKQKKTRWCFA